MQMIWNIDAGVLLLFREQIFSHFFVLFVKYKQLITNTQTLQAFKFFFRDIYLNVFKFLIFSSTLFHVFDIHIVVQISRGNIILGAASL